MRRNGNTQPKDSTYTNDPFFREIKKSQFSPNFYQKMAPKLPKNRQDKKVTMIS